MNLDSNFINASINQDRRGTMAELDESLLDQEDPDMPDQEQLEHTNSNTDSTAFTREHSKNIKQLVEIDIKIFNRL